MLLAAGDLANANSVIEAGGDMAIRLGGRLDNLRTGEPIFYKDHEVFEDGQTTRWRHDFWYQKETTPPASIGAGGSLDIEAADVLNRASTISAGGDLALRAGTLANEARVLEQYIRFYKVEGADTGYRHTYGQGPHGETPSLLVAGGRLSIAAAASLANTGTIEASSAAIVAPSITIGSTDPRLATAPSRLPDAVIDLANPLGGLAGGLAPAAGSLLLGEHEPATRRLPSGREVALSPTLEARAHGLAGGSVRLVERAHAFAPTPSLPAPDPGTIGGARFLHSAPLPGAAGERDPSWILEAAGDTRSGLVFFADATIERRLLQQAVLDQTKRAFLDPSYRTPAAQQEALWRGTVAFLKANPDIRLGDALSAAQRSRLAAPILWYEERDGVLTPQLLLPEGRLAEWTRRAGGQVVAGDIWLSGDRVVNTGRLLAEHGLAIEAESFLNERRAAGRPGREVLSEGGVAMADRLAILTGGDLVNRGGVLAGARSVALSAGGDVLLAAQDVTTRVAVTTTTSGLLSSSSRRVTTTRLVHAGALVSSGGDLVIASAGTLSLLGSSLTAGGEARLTAGGAVTIAAVVDRLSVTRSGQASGFLGLRRSRSGAERTTLATVSSLVSAGGDLTVAAGGDVAVAASHLAAGGDLALAAGAGPAGTPPPR